MSAPRAVAVVGFKKAGKTLVVEALVKELTKRGFRVGTLKHGSERHPLDTPGKDTWRHKESGSIASAILTSGGSAVFINRPFGITDAVKCLGDLDFLILEGFKSLDSVAKIIVPRDVSEVESLSNGLEIVVSASSTLDTSGLKSGAPLIPLERIKDLADKVEEKTFPILTGFNCGSCGFESCGDLARAIIAGDTDASRCVYVAEGAVKLVVNDKDVPIKGFVQDFVSKTVLGMVSSLKGVEEPRTVELRIDGGKESHD